MTRVLNADEVALLTGQPSRGVGSGSMGTDPRTAAGTPGPPEYTISYHYHMASPPPPVGEGTLPPPIPPTVPPAPVSAYGAQGPVGGSVPHGQSPEERAEEWRRIGRQVNRGLFLWFFGAPVLLFAVVALVVVAALVVSALQGLGG